MKKLLFAFLPLLFSCSLYEQRDLSQYVDPFIGTAYVGHTHPAAQLPFGMVQVGPDTGTDLWEHCSGYYNEDSTILGFSHTHLSGTGCPDMGDVMFMPVTGEVSWDQGDATHTSTGYRSAFSRDSEEAAPGYYKVFLNDYHIEVELTATERVGFHRYTFPESDQSGILVDLGHGIGDTTLESSLILLNDSTLAGRRRSKGFVADHSFYFYAVLSKPVTHVTAWADRIISTHRRIEGRVSKMRLSFPTRKDEVVTARVALSTVSMEGAKRNLERETNNKDFEQIRKNATAAWNELLNKIQVKPLCEEQMVSFYTAFYHTLVMPNLVSDADGTYALPDGTKMNNGAAHYTNFSFWDTYRAAHPFYILMYPDKNTAFVKSLLANYRRNGLLSTNEYGQNETGCMIGNHAVAVVADAYLKGCLPDHKKEMAEAIYHSLTTPHPKSDWAMYDRYGYYPFDMLSVESVSRTLEHCYDDYCASLVARQERDNARHCFFKKRAGNYKNLFDLSTRLMRPKDSNGKWRVPFDPFLLSHAGTSGGDYTEGNAWQYTWHVQHDIPQLVNLMGGKDAFERKLDSLFFLDVESLAGGFHGDVTGRIGQYAHGNEPSHHIAYLYNYTGNPYKTQSLIRRIFNQFYLPGRDGLSGNDDCGQMSAWYLFSALGFYPVDPVSGEYVLGAPQMKELKLCLPNGKKFTVKARHLSSENQYVKSIKWNGKEINSFVIRYKDIMEGGILEFEMTSQPVKRSTD